MPVDTDTVGDDPTPACTVCSAIVLGEIMETAPVDVLKAPVLPLKSIAVVPVTTTPPFNVGSPVTVVVTVDANVAIPG